MVFFVPFGEKKIHKKFHKDPSLFSTASLTSTLLSFYTCGQQANEAHKCVLRLYPPHEHRQTICSDEHKGSPYLNSWHPLTSLISYIYILGNHLYHSWVTHRRHTLRNPVSNPVSARSFFQKCLHINLLTTSFLLPSTSSLPSVQHCICVCIQTLNCFLYVSSFCGYLFCIFDKYVCCLRSAFMFNWPPFSCHLDHIVFYTICNYAYVAKSFFCLYRWARFVTIGKTRQISSGPTLSSESKSTPPSTFLI